MNPASSILAKILSWFLLNILLIASILAVFFTFQSQINLHAVLGQPGAHRLRTAGKLIIHDLGQAKRSNWSGILARHATIQGVDFTLVLHEDVHFSSSGEALPEPVLKKVKGMLPKRRPGDQFPPPHALSGFHPNLLNSDFSPPGKPHGREAMGSNPPRPLELNDAKPHFRMRTLNPTRYWSGIRIRLAPGSVHTSPKAVLLAVSDALTGNGFFFDPLPWMVAVAAVILISVIFWMPMVKHISRPLARMTRATEIIAKGRFDVVIHEPRSDEIGRLANGISHMTARLAAFVKGQKRFLGDVAHELGSPLARIQFGLGSLEQRVALENRPRVQDIMEDVEHLSKLVNELLAFSKADMTSKTIKLKRIELLPVVQTAVARETSPETSISVQIDPMIHVMASAELLTRAFANLVRNAVKHAGDTGPIVVTAQRRNSMVDIEVRDTGPGVPELLLDQLFEPFFRPEASRDRDSGGVGLGLAIVKTCAEACKGTVHARNCLPEGFAVTISLPPV